jgi:predicted signal transduction protein with EAL and GGDEF domain
MTALDDYKVDFTMAASLAALGCHDGQGYHFARPLLVEAMTELLERALTPGGFLLAAAGAVTT